MQTTQIQNTMTQKHRKHNGASALSNTFYRIDAALGLSVIFLIVELLGLLTGISMFSYLKSVFGNIKIA